MNRNEYEDLLIIEQAFFDNLAYDPGCEYGSVGVDCKRPFGNSDVEADILEMLSCEPEDEDEYSTAQREYAASLYKEKLVPHLKSRYCIPPMGSPETTHGDEK